MAILCSIYERTELAIREIISVEYNKKREQEVRESERREREERELERREREIRERERREVDERQRRLKVSNRFSIHTSRIHARQHRTRIRR